MVKDLLLVIIGKLYWLHYQMLRLFKQVLILWCFLAPTCFGQDSRSDYANLYFFRDSFYGGLISYHLSINGREVVSLAPYTYLKAELPPGKYTLKAERGFDKDGISVQLKPGESIYIYIEGMGLPPPNPKFVITDGNDAAKRITSLKPAQIKSVQSQNLIALRDFGQEVKFQESIQSENKIDGEFIQSAESKLSSTSTVGIAPAFDHSKSERENLTGEVESGRKKKEENERRLEQDRVERERLAYELEASRKRQQELEAQVALQREQSSSAAQLTQQPLERVFAHRKALVIGNDLYAHVQRLENSVSDAEAMTKALQSVGYKVSKHTNVDEKNFKLALRLFRQQIEPGDEVMVFFSGHGVQIGNANYLLPTDIKGDNEDQIKDEAIQLQRILDDLNDRRSKFALAVIDACRDNPFKGTGRAIGGRGMAPTTAATGQMIMFSAGSGQQALDRLSQSDKERNGVFTRVFVKEMLKPGVPVDRVLRNVRNEVVRLAKSVGHDQTPALYDQAVGDFFFRQ